MSEDKGTLSVDRLLEFTGAEGPVDGADVRARLRLRVPPVWESVCALTGLPNAFRVTTAPAHAKDSRSEASVKILCKANGEKRRQVTQLMSYWKNKINKASIYYWV